MTDALAPRIFRSLLMRCHALPLVPWKEMATDDELEQCAQILLEQTDRLLSILGVDVSAVPLRNPANRPWSEKPAVFRLVADAYDKLDAAQKAIDRPRWERTREKDGHNGDDLMNLLWAILEDARKGLDVGPGKNGKAR